MRLRHSKMFPPLACAALFTFWILALFLATPVAAADRDLNDLQEETSAPFSGYGTFIQGVECVLFQALTGEIYLASELCPVGELAFIVGETYLCASICMQEEACLEVFQITGCTVDQKKLTWGALKSRYTS